MDAGVLSALTTGFNGIKDNIIAVFNVILPVLLSIMGLIIAVSFGIMLFRKFTSKG